MGKNPDITDRKVLDMLVTQLYRKATRDPIIGFFNDSQNHCALRAGAKGQA